MQWLDHYVCSHRFLQIGTNEEIVDEVAGVIYALNRKLTGIENDLREGAFQCTSFMFNQFVAACSLLCSQIGVCLLDPDYNTNAFFLSNVLDTMRSINSIEIKSCDFNELISVLSKGYRKLKRL